MNRTVQSSFRKLRRILRCVKSKLNRPAHSSGDGIRSTVHKTSMSAHLAPAELSPKRQSVVDAAARLFMAHGYGQVSMDAVAREAGVSKATLYAYFTSKDQLFASIIGGAC